MMWWRSEKFWGWMAGIGLILAFAVRFYSAWNVQYTALRDYGVVLLMAKHMAELGEFPVFYYGHCPVVLFRAGPGLPADAGCGGQAGGLLRRGFILQST